MDHIKIKQSNKTIHFLNNVNHIVEISGEELFKFCGFQSDEVAKSEKSLVISNPKEKIVLNEIGSYKVSHFKDLKQTNPKLHREIGMYRVVVGRREKNLLELIDNKTTIIETK